MSLSIRSFFDAATATFSPLLPPERGSVVVPHIVSA